jgi:hypothetical protein
MVGNFTIGIFSTIFQKQPIIILYSIQYFLTKLLTISIGMITLNQLAITTNEKLSPNLAEGEKIMSYSVHQLLNETYKDELKEMLSLGVYFKFSSDG